MSAAVPSRFTFDLDLGHRQEKSRVLTEGAMASMMADARTAGFAEGFAAGEQGVTARASRQLADAAEALGERVAGHAAAIDDLRRTMLAEAVEVAGTIAKKLAASLMEREPTAEIEALISECLASLDAVPHLVIRCNEELADAVRDIATARVETSGFTGRLIVMGDPEIAPGDCRLEWVDGGLVRDGATLTAEIDRRISAFLAARAPRSGASGAQEME